MPKTTINNHRKINRCNSTNNARNWADLPTELLEKIGEHLNSRIDVFRFRAVCSSWRSAISLSPSSYINDFTFPFIVCRLEHNRRSCLVKLIETTQGGFKVLNPLTIPKAEFICGKSLNLLDCRLIELGEGLHFDSSIDYGELNVKKAVLFRGVGIVAIYDYVKLGFRVFWDDNWTNLSKNPKILYTDIVLCQGEVYVMDKNGNVYWIDKSMNVVKYLPRLNSSGQQKNLVESEGQLYVVETYSRLWTEFDEFGELIDSGTEKVDMKVYKLDDKWGIWVQVTSLNDRVFVLGEDVCFSVSINDFPSCEGNCIYFIDRLSARDAAFSHRLVRYYDAKIGYYVPRVFKLDDRVMRDVQVSSPSLKRLFSLPKDCFCSTLSSP
ncbi:putative F-box protein At1g65770 [Chenopodium quinoa]|uniref:putative F-box protein At1g65770 n=1 Tax=Chenopodium quinoa TaxID=63459 RepID=UPI000B77B716|nr:putative F-box protein At1g65770 [Chenopodium quinoa]